MKYEDTCEENITIKEENISDEIWEAAGTSSTCPSDFQQYRVSAQVTFY